MGWASTRTCLLCHFSQKALAFSLGNRATNEIEEAGLADLDRGASSVKRSLAAAAKGNTTPLLKNQAYSRYTLNSGMDGRCHELICFSSCCQRLFSSAALLRRQAPLVPTGPAFQC